MRKNCWWIHHTHTHKRKWDFVTICQQRFFYPASSHQVQHINHHTLPPTTSSPSGCLFSKNHNGASPHISTPQGIRRLKDTLTPRAHLPLCQENLLVVVVVGVVFGFPWCWIIEFLENLLLCVRLSSGPDQSHHVVRFPEEDLCEAFPKKNRSPVG